VQKKSKVRTIGGKILIGWRKRRKEDDCKQRVINSGGHVEEAIGEVEYHMIPTGNTTNPPP